MLSRACRSMIRVGKLCCERLVLDEGIREGSGEKPSDGRHYHCVALA